MTWGNQNTDEEAAEQLCAAWGMALTLTLALILTLTLTLTRP